jgi:hypothetical protein
MQIKQENTMKIQDLHSGKIIFNNILLKLYTNRNILLK